MLTEEINIGNNELDNLNPSTIQDTFVSVFKFCIDGAIQFINNDYVQTGYSTANEIAGELSNCLGTLNAIKKVISIPNVLFMKKFEKYCKGVSRIPGEKRQKYLKKLGKESLNKNGVFILEVINHIEEYDKIDIILKLQEAEMDNTISNEEFRRLVLHVDHTPYSDLLFMKDHICNNNFHIESSSEESLSANGWIIFVGISIVNSSPDTAESNLFRYTESAKQLCKIVYNIVPDDAVTEEALIIQSLD